MTSTARSRVSRSGAVRKPASAQSKSPSRSRSKTPAAAKQLSHLRADPTRALQEQEHNNGDDGRPSKRARIDLARNQVQDKPTKTALPNNATRGPPTGSSPKNSPSRKSEEKRPRMYRSKPPASFKVKLQRAQTQRMIVLGRKRARVDGAPSEAIDIVGSTGNIYTVTVGREPGCSCPDARKGNECKHKVYAMHTVLKAPEHLQYQLGLLRSELEDIFAGAPPIPTDVGRDGREGEPKGSRKPTDGECPICYMELDEEHNPLVWCRSQCGHNLHKTCFYQWAASQRGTQVRCVYCRTPWDLDVGDVAAVRSTGRRTADGYVNVADQFGISRTRDYSDYHQPWARRHFGHGF